MSLDVVFALIASAFCGSFLGIVGIHFARWITFKLTGHKPWEWWL